MKIRLSNSEYVMVDIPQELTPQGLYGLIKRLQRIQKFFSEGDVFSLKGEKGDTNDDGEVYTPVKKTRSPSVFKDLLQDRKMAVKALKDYFGGGEHSRLEIARKRGVALKNYSAMIHYVRKKWKITPQEVGMKEFNLYHSGIRINGKR